MTTIKPYFNAILHTARGINIWRESLAGIGRFEVLLENQGNEYGGTLDPQDPVELQINDIAMMKGYIDDVLPFVDESSAVYRNLMKIVGRDWGQPLASLFFSKEYDSSYSLMEIISDICIRTDPVIEPYYIPGGVGPFLPYSAKNQFGIEALKDLAKLTNHDFWMTDELYYGSPRLDVCPISNPPNSGVTLKAVAGASDNNILALKEIGEKVGFDIRNYIQVEAGDVEDHWTEENASDWTPYTDNTLSDELISGLFLVGNASIECYRSTTGGEHGMKMIFSVPKVGYSSIDLKIGGDCHFYVRSNVPFGWNRWRPRLVDGSGNVIEYYSFNVPNETDEFPYDKWHKVKFTVGEDEEIQNVLTNQHWWFITGSSFNWSNVKELHLESLAENQTGSYWTDGLKLPIPARAISESGASQTLYRKRMIPISRSDLKSQIQLQDVADVELSHRKDPTQRLNVTATFQSSCKYPGYTVLVKAPSSGIGTAEAGVTYRILSLHHFAEPREDKERGHDAITEFELVKHMASPGEQPIDPLRFRLSQNPFWTTIQRLEQRIRSLERGR